MDVKQAIQRRRAYRSLEPVEISAAILGELIQAARLAPSCFNSQPARFVFIHDSAVLAEMKTAITKGNAWAHSASLIIAIFSRREDDCIIRDREYHQFDCGLAAAFLILRATELGLVAHPIAGFSPQRTREILGISEDDQVITLIIVGKKRERINPELTAKQVEWEKQRPARLPLEKVFFENRLRLDSAGGPNESGGKS
jgi:nitroreductase